MHYCTNPNIHCKTCKYHISFKVGATNPMMSVLAPVFIAYVIDRKHKHKQGKADMLCNGYGIRLLLNVFCKVFLHLAQRWLLKGMNFLFSNDKSNNFINRINCILFFGWSFFTETLQVYPSSSFWTEANNP